MLGAYCMAYMSAGQHEGSPRHAWCVLHDIHVSWATRGKPSPCLVRTAWHTCQLGNTREALAMLGAYCMTYMSTGQHEGSPRHAWCVLHDIHVNNWATRGKPSPCLVRTAWHTCQLGNTREALAMLGAYCMAYMSTGQHEGSPRHAWCVLHDIHVNWATRGKPSPCLVRTAWHTCQLGNTREALAMLGAYCMAYMSSGQHEGSPRHAWCVLYGIHVNWATRGKPSPCLVRTAWHTCQLGNTREALAMLGAYCMAYMSAGQHEGSPRHAWCVLHGIHVNWATRGKPSPCLVRTAWHTCQPSVFRTETPSFRQRRQTPSFSSRRGRKELYAIFVLKPIIFHNRFLHQRNESDKEKKKSHSFKIVAPDHARINKCSTSLFVMQARSHGSGLRGLPICTPGS